jgi:hypothetical protein
MSDAAPINQAALRHGAVQPRARVAQPGALLFEFLHRHDRIRCELRDHGEYGVEAQFLHNEELFIGRTFHQRLDLTRTPREMAIAWAHTERAAILRDRDG